MGQAGPSGATHVSAGPFARALVRLWFRKIQKTGPPLPTGAVLLVLNHPNGLLDPLIPAALLKPPPRFMAKATLWKLLPLRPFLALFKPIPVRRAQDEKGLDATARARAVAQAFEAVHESFGFGQCVAIFPEGISHGHPDLAPLKTGAARIALSSPTPVSLVPAGLVYGRRDLFRHSVLLRLGAAIPFSDLKGQGTEPEAVRELTARIREALLPLTLHAEAEDLLALAQDTAWLLAEGPRSKVDLEAHQLRVRAMLDRLRTWSEPAQNALRLEVAKARGWLHQQGLRPDQVGYPYPWDEVARWLPKAALRHVLALPLAPLALAFWPPYALVRWSAGHFTDELDQTATFKLLGGFLLHPLWLVGLASVAWRAFGLPGLLATGIAGLSALALLPLLERLREDWQAIRGFLRRRHPETKELLEAKARLLAAFPELGR